MGNGTTHSPFFNPEFFHLVSKKHEQLFGDVSILASKLVQDYYIVYQTLLFTSKSALDSVVPILDCYKRAPNVNIVALLDYRVLDNESTFCSCGGMIRVQTAFEFFADTLAEDFFKRREAKSNEFEVGNAKKEDIKSNGFGVGNSHKGVSKEFGVRNAQKGDKKHNEFGFGNRQNEVKKRKELAVGNPHHEDKNYKANCVGNLIKKSKESCPGNAQKEEKENNDFVAGNILKHSDTFHFGTSENLDTKRDAISNVFYQHQEVLTVIVDTLNALDTIYNSGNGIKKGGFVNMDLMVVVMDEQGKIQKVKLLNPCINQVGGVIDEQELQTGFDDFLKLELFNLGVIALKLLNPDKEISLHSTSFEELHSLCFQFHTSKHSKLLHESLWLLFDKRPDVKKLLKQFEALKMKSNVVDEPESEDQKSFMLKGLELEDSKSNTNRNESFMWKGLELEDSKCNTNRNEGRLGDISNIDLLGIVKPIITLDYCSPEKNTNWWDGTEKEMIGLDYRSPKKNNWWEEKDKENYSFLDFPNKN